MVQGTVVQGSLGTGSLGTGSLGTGSLGTGSLGTGSLGTGSLGTGSLGTGSLGTGSLGTGSLGTGSLGTGCLGTGSLGTGSRGTSSLGTGSLGTGSLGPVPEILRTVPESLGTVPGSLGTVPESLGTVPGSLGTVPESLETVPESLGTVSERLGTVPESLGTVHRSVGTVPGGQRQNITELEESAVPHREGARRMTPHKSDACRKEIETLLEYDMIELSKSPWACGVVMAKKKGDELRFCCDFRYLNSVTVKDAYSIPRIDESLSKLGDAKFFTTLDLGSAFWQVPLRKQDRDKTGFACELGLFQWKRMPFGLCNATVTFQRLMAHALIGVTKKYDNLVMCYVDDVVIATPTLEDHIERLDEVFACMKRSGLKCKPSKCEILKDSIKYLGRMVYRHGIRPDPDAVEAVLTWKSPKTEHQLTRFLGFANYYREFIKGYADKVYPMQQLMRHKGKKFTWNNAAEESFQRIKKELCEAPVLGMPTEKGMYVLDTDASVVAISGILHQEQKWNGKTVLRPIAYGSKVLSDTEMKYGAPKAEIFAVVTFVEKYRAYLGSEPFKLRVDNRALSWLKTYSMDQSYIGRWIVRLDGYNKIIEHRTRDRHQNADSLIKKTEFYERQEQSEANRPESWIRKRMIVFHSRDGSTSQAN